LIHQASNEYETAAIVPPFSFVVVTSIQGNK
jgi:hypothetical protein